MTRFGLTGLLLVMLLILAAIAKTDEIELRFALILLAGVTLGAVIAVEARHQSWIHWREDGKKGRHPYGDRDSDGFGKPDPPNSD